MITKSQEDYLKIIFDENLKQNKITNKFISNSLNIKAPSVSNMLQKLINDSLIEKDELLGFSLTNKGKDLTKELLSKHRLWEVFLIDYLGYTWDEVHNDADKLEHVTSNELLIKLNEFLGKPKTCPHGKLIYINTDEKRTTLGNNLSELKVGYEGVINVIEDNKELLKYLDNKKIKLYDEFKIININKFDQSITLKVDEKDIIISNLAASKIYVK